MFPCAINSENNKKKMENSTACTNNFSNNECLINLWQGSASQWPVREVWRAFQQLHSCYSSDIHDTAPISIKKACKHNTHLSDHLLPLSMGSFS